MRPPAWPISPEPSPLGAAELVTLDLTLRRIPLPEQVYAHFIGAGGAGMSGIALVLAERGALVTGSDLKESRYSRALVAAGVPVAIGHRAENLGTPADRGRLLGDSRDAIPRSSRRVRLGIPIWPRARMLAHLAGGRTTSRSQARTARPSTSSMMATMLSGMGLDPTFLIGGEVDGFDTNAVNGTGEHYVVEADESDGSFVFLDPHIAIVTNIEADHLDHYGTLGAVEETFVEFMSRVAADGALVVCGDDARVSSSWPRRRTDASSPTGSPRTATCVAG